MNQEDSMPKFRTLPAIFLGLAIITSSAAPCLAFSQQDGSAEGRAACTPDVFRLCSSHIPDADAIVVCLKSNKQNLSPACRATLFGNRK
jgi:Trk K+ transport system NAD-binding subunit